MSGAAAKDSITKNARAVLRHAGRILVGCVRLPNVHKSDARKSYRAVVEVHTVTSMGQSENWKFSNTGVAGSR